MNHRRLFFAQAAADWDALEVKETHVRLREIVTELTIAPGPRCWTWAAAPASSYRCCARA